VEPWPVDEAALAEAQAALAALDPPPWRWFDGAIVGGCALSFVHRGAGAGAAGDPGFAAAVAIDGPRRHQAQIEMPAPAPFRRGLLALREGPLLEEAVRALPFLPDVLLVDATGRDHPRGCGLALHLGARLGVPTVGVTRRPLLAAGSPSLLLDGAEVARWVTTRPSARPLVAHAAWRTDVETAVAVVLATATHARTPEPIRLARQLARTARAGQ
jgi:deoxyribonuclease V